MKDREGPCFSILAGQPNVARQALRRHSSLKWQVKGRPHVVDMLGFCGSTVVTEAYTSDAKTVLQKLTEPLPIEDVVSISVDAAVGLRSLHEAVHGPIVHFDIKPSQLLIGTDGGVTLGDFNLSYFMGDDAEGSPCPFNKKDRHRHKNWRKSPEYVLGKVRQITSFCIVSSKIMDGTVGP